MVQLPLAALQVITKPPTLPGATGANVMLPASASPVPAVPAAGLPLRVGAAQETLAGAGMVMREKLAAI